MFFEPPPPADEAKQPPQPVWSAPPDSELGVSLPMRAIVATGSAVAIALTDCVAFSTGFEIGISVRSREQLDPHAMGMGAPRAGIPLPDDLLRIGVQFADGRKATSLGFRGPQFHDYFVAVREGREPKLPVGPLMMPRGGGGGGRRWDHRYWIWPLPPEGPLLVVSEWPARGIAVTWYEIDGTQIRLAAQASTKLWEDDPSGGTWTSSTIRHP